MDAELACASAKKISADADVVAKVEQFPEFIACVAYGILLDVKLQAPAILLQVSEAGLTHKADPHDSSGNAHVYARFLQILAGFATVRRENLRDGVAEVVLRGVCRLPESLYFLQLFAAYFVNVLVE